MSATTEQERFPYQVFAVLWAVALLFETARAFLGSGFLTIVLSITLGRCAALWVLARPGATIRLVALNAAIMLTIFLKLPKANNHGIFIFVASATILLAYLRLKLADRTAAVPGARLYAIFAPVLRWELLAMYFWATVHKLNVDFFDLEVSCGQAQLRNMHANLPIVPTGEWLQLFGIYGTLALEGGIPLLLLFRRTRVVGILLAAGFHYLLGVGYPGFSAMLLAMLSLFAPPAFFASVRAAAERAGAALTTRAGAAARALRAAIVGGDRTLAALVVGVGAATLFALLVLPDARVVDTGPPRLAKGTVVAAWLVWGAAFVLVFAAGVWRGRAAGAAAEPPPGMLRIRPLLMAAMPLLVLLIGAAPHLGLKNTQSFAMFSNLETGAGRSNHLFIPSSWQRWDHLNDLVVIHSSNDPALAKLVGPSWKTFNFFSTFVVDSARMARELPEPEWRLPYFALRRRVASLTRLGQKDIEVTYERGGQIHRVRRAEEDPELSRVPYFLNKFLLMRAVPDSDRGYCLW